MSGRRLCLTMASVLLASAASLAVDAPTGTIRCASAIGGRTHCPADTSQGVALLRSEGEAACLLGKTWGYDDTGIWVSDGCAAVFAAREAVEAKISQVEEAEKSPSYLP